MIRIIGVVLVLIGLFGLGLAGFYATMGEASLPGALSALLSGTAFLWMCRTCNRRGNGD